MLMITPMFKTMIITRTSIILKRCQLAMQLLLLMAMLMLLLIVTMMRMLIITGMMLLRIMPVIRYCC